MAPQGRPKAKVTVCTQVNCERPVLAKGLCLAHYRRQATGAPMDAPVRIRGLDQVQFTMRLPREYYEAYGPIAEEQGTTVYEVCRKLLMDWQDQRAEAVSSGKPFPIPSFPKPTRRS